MSRRDSEDQHEDRPTPQELAVLRAMLDHGTIEHAAEALYLSAHTVDTYLDRLRKKSGKHYLHQIVHWADEHGWWQETEEPK